MDGWFFPFPWGMSGDEIYNNFQNGQGPGGLAKSAASVRDLIKNYEQRAVSISKLTERMEQAWQGDAGDKARRGAGPLAVEHGHAAPEMNVAQTLVMSQVSAYERAAVEVVQVPPEPNKPGFWDNVTTLGGAGRSYEEQMTEVAAANDHNVSVMSSYEDVTGTNTSGMPKSYGSITPDFSAVGVEQEKKPPKPPPPKPHKPEPPVTNNPKPPGTVTHPPNVPIQPPNQPGRPPGQVDPNRPTNPQQLPPGRTDPGHYLPPNPRPGPPGPGGPGQNYGPGYGPGYLPAAGFGPTGGGGGGAGGGGADGTGRGGAGGRGPGGAAGGFAEEGGRPGARGGAMGAGAGAAAAEAAAGRGAAGGRGGMGGMPMGGGGRGQGGEDGEHHRPSFLVEADPDETFGTDEVTAPPVIGE